MISRSEFEETIREYNEKYYELDNAIKARDKVIDDQRNKVSDYRERFYNIQHENDDLRYELEREKKYSETILKDFHDLKSNLQKAQEELKAKDDAVTEIVDKFTNDKATADEKFAQHEKMLEVAKNVIKELKEDIEDKNTEISNIQCSNNAFPKFSTETQTSLKDEIDNAVTVDKFASERRLWLSKFKEVQDTINLQIVDLVKTVGQLKDKKEKERCVNGWKCKRRFCKYSHEYLYSYTKFTCSKRGESFVQQNNLEHHEGNKHEEICSLKLRKWYRRKRRLNEKSKKIRQSI